MEPLADAVPELSAADVAAAGRRLPARFRCRLHLEGAGPGSRAAVATVLVEDVLRLLPGRRLTARVRLEPGRPESGRPEPGLAAVPAVAVLKLFLGPGARRYCAREARGAALVTAAGVQNPALRGRVAGAPGETVAARGLLFEYVDGARPLSDDDSGEFLGAVTALARLHAAGAVHRDPHLENFLLRPGAGVGGDAGLWLVDGDGVRRAARRGNLRQAASLANLARLSAERPPQADVELPRVYRAYAAARGWAGGAAAQTEAVRALTRLTRRQRRARVRRYLAKAQRDCTEFHCSRTWRHYLVCQRGFCGPELARFVDDPDAGFRNAQVLKAGNSATVVRLHLQGRPVVVKRYNQKNAWQALKRAVRPVARFRRAWLNGQRLSFLGIPTARPLALLEQRFGPLRGRAYLIMEDLGDVDLGAEVAARGLDEARLEQVVRLFQGLAAAGLTHGDTKISNFLVTPRGVSLVDLDALRPSRAGQAKDRRRFLANFDADPALRRRCAAAFAAAGLDT